MIDNKNIEIRYNDILDKPVFCVDAKEFEINCRDISAIEKILDILGIEFEERLGSYFSDKDLTKNKNTQLHGI